jgi:hypothetical protein
MREYRVRKAYRAGNLGPWQPGDVVTLDEVVAAWVERDSPGTLEPVEKVAEERALERPPADRMVRGRQKRSG